MAAAPLPVPQPWGVFFPTEIWAAHWIWTAVPVDVNVSLWLA